MGLGLSNIQRKNISFGTSCWKYVIGFLTRFTGVARGGGPGVPVSPPPPFVSLFLSKQPTIFRGENAMTIMFDTV